MRLYKKLARRTTANKLLTCLMKKVKLLVMSENQQENINTTMKLDKITL